MTRNRAHSSCIASRAPPFLSGNLKLWCVEESYHLKPRSNDDAQPQAATAAVILGGGGIVARSVDGRARLASTNLVGDCGCGFCFGGVLVSCEAGMASER